jgi:NADPH:quinone reductase-like Zn-dependent oxidoreductase
MANSQNTMNAIYFEEFGGPEKLKMGRFNIPLPAADEVQIKIVCTAVNPVDWKIREGMLQNRMPNHFPIIPGWDASGTISAVGSNVKKVKVGDAVFAYCRKSIIQDGTYAEFICLNAENVAFKPNNLSFAQSAAFPLAGLTAWQSLFDAAGLQKGELILIQAGAGGVGSLAIQFAKIAGARIITTARQSNHDYVKSLGADMAVDYQSQSLKEEIKKFAPNGLDVVFDTVGGETLRESYLFLKPGGRLVSIVEPPDQARANEHKIKGLYHFVSPNGKQLQQIADLIQAGKVKPIQIQEMPLEKAAEAQELNRQGHGQGKIVLNV